MSEIPEIVQTIEFLQREFEELAIRGLRTCGPEHLTALTHVCEEFSGIGAAHLAGRIRELIHAIESDDRKAAEALLRAQSTLRTFERVLTLEFVEQVLTVGDN
ncbi:MAG: hypothetical protein ACI8P0_004347 [Planctomycetaceae bacterium]|jgi:hypothetical protein